MGEQKSSARHQALYRKYRVRSIEDVVGQEHVTTTLANALKQDKISHAYLFTGPRGTGKTSIARILAHQINQLAYNDETPHLDIIEIDAASNRRIDDIRELRDKVQITPTSAKYKVYIIDEVHMLTTESFNALLKTLEEPPAHVIFILATTEVHKLPATIISRTQRHTFKAIPLEKLVAHLKKIASKEKISIDDEALELIAEHGNGSVRDSLSLLDQVASSDETITTQQIELLFGIAPKNALLELLTATRRGQHSEVLRLTEAHLSAGLTPAGLAEQLLRQIRADINAQQPADGATLELMSQLLQVGNAAFARLKLETSLLSVAPAALKPPTDQKVLPAPDQPTNPITPSAEAEEKPAPKTAKQSASPEPKPKAVAAVKPAQKIDDMTWPQILQAIKQKNSPLYTVLRMAAPEFNETELKLTFRFPFHQKRIEDAKHKAIVAATVLEVTGNSLIILTAVDSNVTVEAVEIATEPAAADPAHASHIALVQDIMGGGEVVDA